LRREVEMVDRLTKLAAAGLGAMLAIAAPAAPPASPAPDVQLAAPPAAPKPAPGTAPHIVFDAVLVNLGDVIHGQDAVATFTYRNTGNAPLHILGAKPG
jgi:hypothetical protein